MRAMVLAAGVGSRLDPLTNLVPKPLVPIANRPVMEHILNLLKVHGINEVICNLHYLPEQIKDYFGDGSRFGVPLRYRYEPELSGDAGGVRACAKFLDNDTFLVVMGDLLTDANLTQIIEQHKKHQALATIAIKEVNDVQHFGVVVRDKNGFIVGFQEKPNPSEALSNFASTGIYVLEPAIFKYIPQTGSYGFGRQLFPLLVKQSLPVLGVPIEEYWSDVGTIGQYKVSNFDAAEGRLRVALAGKPTAWGFIGTEATISHQANIQGTLVVGNNSHIASGVIIEGRVIIGDNCKVEEQAYLKDTIIWPHATVQQMARLTGCIVSSHFLVEHSTSHNEIVCQSKT